MNRNPNFNNSFSGWGKTKTQSSMEQFHRLSQDLRELLTFIEYSSDRCQSPSCPDREEKHSCDVESCSRRMKVFPTTIVCAIYEKKIPSVKIPILNQLIIELKNRRLLEVINPNCTTESYRVHPKCYQG